MVHASGRLVMAATAVLALLLLSVQLSGAARGVVQRGRQGYAPSEHRSPLSGEYSQGKEEGSADSRDASPREAYITLCYSDAYVLGVRVLGQSLRESGTTREMVVLVTSNVTKDAKRTLGLDGWTVKEVEMVNNPGKGPQAKGKRGFPPRFWAVYTKLLIFSLVSYDRLVYLDADVLVLDNLDSLFSCVGFCAVMRGGERFNSGVMVLEPDVQVFEDMMNRISSTPSYTGGDQGFLNEYYNSILDGPVFNPAAVPKRKDIEAMRLGTEFNSDVGAFVINSGQWHHSSRPKVLHYTLGPFKPWHWWMGWVAEQHRLWLKVRMRLGEDAQGYVQGERRQTLIARRVLVAIPLLLWAALLRRKAWRVGLQQLFGSWKGDVIASRARPGGRSGSGGCPSAASDMPGSAMVQLAGALALAPPSRAAGTDGLARLLDPWSAGGSVLQHPASLPAAASIIGIASLLVSLALSVTIVIPHDLDPPTAWTLVYEWTYLGMSLTVGRFLAVCYRLGQLCTLTPNGAEMSAHVTASGGSVESELLPTDGHVNLRRGLSSAALRASRATFLGVAVAAVALALAPWIARMAGVHDIVAKILITSFSGVFAVLILVHALNDMASVWFTAGVMDANVWKAGV